MPADTKHKLYNSYLSLYEIIKDCKDGEEAIKLAGVKYLPKLSGQQQSSYNAYKDRGAFLNATGRTINALTGLMIRKDPIVEVPKVMEEELDAITSTGLSITELIRDCCEAALSYARQGLLVDADEKGEEVFISVYDALSVINWRTRVIKGEEKLTMLCLMESVSEIDPNDPFVTEEKQQVRVLQLEGEEDDDAEVVGKLVVRLFQKPNSSSSWKQVGEDLMPHIHNVRLDYIPFVFIGAMTNEIAPEKPIMADLATLNIGHWKIEVDYKHGIHLCALPTPWAAGFGKNAELFIGPDKAWVSEDPKARAGYLEFTGEGLKAIQEALDRAETGMATMGSRILEAQKKHVEAFQTVRIRQGSDIATLSNVAGSVEKGVESALNLFAERMGIPDAEVQVTLNRDFVDADLSPEALGALLLLVQSGKMSTGTFLWNIKRGELLPPDQTIQDEQTEIELETEAMDFEDDEEVDKDGNPIKKAVVSE